MRNGRAERAGLGFRGLGRCAGGGQDAKARAPGLSRTIVPLLGRTLRQAVANAGLREK